MVEIGSEFWEAADTGKKKYLISGRAALEYIVRDILAEQRIDSVLMPSYCCHTMIEPFARHGIRIRFYDVFYDKDKGLCVELPEERSTIRNHNNEIFYYMTYFVFRRLPGVDPEMVRRKYGLIIEDQTHSWLSADFERTALNADYTYISFRKWTGVYGIAEARKRVAGFIPETGRLGKEYTDRRKDAMALKRKYINQQKSIETGNGIQPDYDIERAKKCKKAFLEQYGEAEAYLENEYVGYTPASECAWQLLNADWAFVRERRRKNADALIRGLKEIPEVTLLFGNRKETDTPLFVPVLVEESRDGLKDYLVSHQVFCPVHWPLSDYHQGLSERGKRIYGKELSLVCDQRYTEKDMEYIVHLIRNYFSDRKKE